MSLIRKLLLPDRAPAVPPGVRVYAIGDIHGRHDLLRSMLARIDEDVVERKIRRAVLVFLGDYIDRGPQSSQVIDRLISLRDNPAFESYFLMGNHEEVLLRVLKADLDLFRRWVKFGGRECLQSYGLDAETMIDMEGAEVAVRLKAAIPRRHREFLAALDDSVRVGDYLFVHAGLRPGRALEAQSQEDMRWIRSPFLEDEESDHGYMIVHGHSISEGVDWRRNRIGIDTGAYQTGLLTALVLEGIKQVILDTSHNKG